MSSIWPTDKSGSMHASKKKIFVSSACANHAPFLLNAPSNDDRNWVAALQKDQGTFFDKIWLLGSHARSQFVIDQNNFYLNLTMWI